MKKKVLIVGAGPAGLFAAYRLSTSGKFDVTIFEKGYLIENRRCPAIENKTSCVKCKTCSIMTGFSGCGAFSDAKFPITNDFGGSLYEKCGKEKSLELQREVDSLNEQFYSDAGYSDFPKLYSTKDTVYKKICIQHNLHLLDADIRHLGTDKSKIVFSQMYKVLKDLGVKIIIDANVNKIEKIDNKFTVYARREDNETVLDFKEEADLVIIAAGRSGSNWTKDICKKLNIATTSNRIDIGIRFECPNEIWNHITKDLYESKITYRTKTYEDVVRTFCMNPSGYVVTENTENGITVNGHSFEDKNMASENTNFALLVSKTFTEPFNGSNEYGEAIIQLSNLLGGGVIVQRYGDLIRGKRSTKEHLKQNYVRPTLNAEAGDLSLVLPKRILDDILEMIEQLDHLVPGMKNDDNLLYGCEIKQYNSIVQTDDKCESSIKGLYFAGDGAGYTHSLSQAAANGLYVADNII